MDNPKKSEPKNDPFALGEKEYSGNFFGWKFSIAGMIVTAVLLFIYIFLSWKNDTPLPQDPPPKPPLEDTIIEQAE